MTGSTDGPHVLIAKAVTELETLCRKLVEWDVHPDELVSHKMRLEQTPEAFDLFSRGECSKVVITMD